MRYQFKENASQLNLYLLKRLGNARPKPEHVEMINFLVNHLQTILPLTFDKRLSQREMDCLFLAAKGHTSFQTAKILHISTATVESHRKHIKRKLNCMNLTQAVFEGMRFGYLPAFPTPASTIETLS